MDEIDLAAEREGQAIHTVKEYAVQRPRRSHVISRQNVKGAIKEDFMEQIKWIQQHDVQT